MSVRMLQGNPTCSTFSVFFAILSKPKVADSKKQSVTEAVFPKFGVCPRAKTQRLPSKFISRTRQTLLLYGDIVSDFAKQIADIAKRISRTSAFGEQVNSCLIDPMQTITRILIALRRLHLSRSLPMRSFGRLGIFS